MATNAVIGAEGLRVRQTPATRDALRRASASTDVVDAETVPFRLLRAVALSTKHDEETITVDVAKGDRSNTRTFVAFVHGWRPRGAAKEAVCEPRSARPLSFTHTSMTASNCSCAYEGWLDVSVTS